MPKVRVWTTQIQVLGSWWRNWFFTFCTKIPSFLTLEFLKIALFVSAFFRPKCPYIRGFEWFVRPQNSRISRISSRCPEYARNEEFSKNTLTKIRLSLSLRFDFPHLDFKSRIDGGVHLQFKYLNLWLHISIQSLIFKYANIKLSIWQLIIINIHRWFVAIKHLKLRKLCHIWLKRFNLLTSLMPIGVAYTPYFNICIVNTLFITSYLNIETSTKTL